MSRETLIIKRSDIEEVFTMKDAIEATEEAFRLYGQKKVLMPSKVYLFFEKGDLRSMPSCIPDLKIAGVKNVNVHPENTEHPSVMATLTLIDTETGFPLAFMDATAITNMRTGASGGIAAKYLARKDSRVAGFIGAGKQAETQLEALLITCPGVNRIVVFDVNTKHAEAFVKWCKGTLNKDATIGDSIEAVCKQADILTTTTPVHTPVVRNRYVGEGLHINAIGADAVGKQELESFLLKRARIVIDSWEQASHSGEINIPVAMGIINQSDIYADIGEIVTGKKIGRDDAKQITVFDSTGLGIQDLACAKHIYNEFMASDALRGKLTSADVLSLG